ncbi:hypothetical protein ABI59_14680 [Acidobacteria bacterium Mor1]|nr:hypothetical protein ABI59_14680 [Acidobacteria bacterium Mor1]
MGIDRIDGINASNRPTENPSKVRSEPSGKQPGRPGDQVELSAEARQIATLTGAAKDLPEVRAEKVKAIQKSLADGTYKVDSRQLAQKVLEFERGLDF